MAYGNHGISVKRIFKWRDRYCKGDADGNGKVEADDAALVLQKVLTGAKVAIEDVATNAFELIDADNDGQLTAKDAAYILQKALDSTFLMPNEK